MLAFSILIFTTCLIFPAIFHIVNGQQPFTEEEIETCRATKTYSISDEQYLDIELDYDPGMEPDITYIKNMCKTQESFSEVVCLTFVPGFTITVNDEGIGCTNPDDDDTSCTNLIEHVCASQLVDDFSKFVCCTALDGTDSRTCFQNQNSDLLEEFDQCVCLEHSSINPIDIIKSNSEASHKKSTDGNCAPVFLINGNRDDCARINFYHEPEDVVLAMLAQEGGGETPTEEE